MAAGGAQKPRSHLLFEGRKKTVEGGTFAAFLLTAFFTVGLIGAVLLRVNGMRLRDYWPVLASGGIVALFLAAVILLIGNSARLGWLFVPAFLLFVSLFLIGQYFILRRREMNFLQTLLGDERFFKVFPRQRKRRKRLDPPQMTAEEKQKRQEELMDRYAVRTVEHQEKFLQEHIKKSWNNSNTGE